MKRVSLVAVVLSILMGLTAYASSSPWEQPAAALAEEIVGILGPGQAHLTIRNLSTIPTDNIPAIRRLLEQDLKAHGVLASGAESANAIRVTLSENIRERLWVAEVVEGNETRITMVHVDPGSTGQAQAGSEIALRKQSVLTSSKVVLAALETAHGLVTVEPEEIVIYGHAAEGWREQKRLGIGQKKPLARDPRGVVFPAPDDEGFVAFVANMACSGSYQPVQPAGNWTVRCTESDDPWTIVQPPPAQPNIASQTQPSIDSQMNISVAPIKAFYNAARNYFTGVVTPSLGVDLPPFYSASQVVRSAVSAPLLIIDIDGKVQLVESGALKPITGTRDWGSDFAVLHSSCGSGMQIIASGSGEAVSDSLRAYELPTLEAIPASALLSMDGTVTALWTAPDGKSVFAVVRKPAGPGSADQYEVDRVTASCN
jgi:hypothetical protein